MGDGHDLPTNDDELLRAVAAAPEVAPRELRPGTRLADEFQIERRVGRGGMGVVYLARDLRLDREVAIKVHAELAPDALERTLREARIMARLNHPNVATIYEVGLHEGRLFIAMEYLDGGTVREWARPGRTWREVADRLLAAARGLVAAHAAGVVHRDFKPDNVLLGVDGRIRVADFGVARLDEATEPGGAIGTPRYMAPEQHDGHADERADQYAFCTSFDELLGRTRRPRWLQRLIARGLARDPAARHPSMRAVVVALERGLARRRRALLGAALIGAMVVPTAVVVAQREARAARCEDDGAAWAGVWDAARRGDVRRAFLASGRGHAEETTRRLDDALARATAAWTAMHVDACRATRVRGDQSEALLDRRMICLADRREAIRALVDVLGRADGAVVDRALPAVAALPPLDACADARTLLDLAPSPPGVDVTPIRARTARAAAGLSAGRYEAATADARAAVDEAVRVHDRVGEASAHLVEGQVALATSQLPAAARALSAALWAATETGAHATAFEAALQLADEERLAQRFDQGAWWLDYASAARTAGGTIAGATGRMELERAEQRYDRGDYRGAIEAGRTALAALADRPHDAARVHALLAEASRTLDELGPALVEATAAVTTIERDLGPEHPDLLPGLDTIAGIELARDDPASAGPVSARALAIAERTFGRDHPRVADALVQVARVAAARDDVLEAARLLEQARAIADARHDDARLASILGFLGADEVFLGRYDDAARDLSRAATINEARRGPTHPALGPIYTKLASVAYARGELDEAMRTARHAAALLEPLGPDNSHLQIALEVQGSILRARGDFGGALAIFQRIAAAQQQHGAADDDSALAHLDLALAWIGLGRLPEAEAELAQASALDDKLGGSAVRPAIRAATGALALARGRPRDAIAPLEEAERLRARPGAVATIPAERVEALLALARALWDGGGDRDRARALAERARIVAAPLRDLAALRRSIEGWATDHAAR